jgi:ATP-dependent Lon protease
MRDFIIENYAREAGVRSLKRHILRICEKIAFEFVSNPNPQNLKVSVTRDNIEDYIGAPIF